MFQTKKNLTLNLPILYLELDKVKQGGYLGVHLFMLLLVSKLVSSRFEMILNYRVMVVRYPNRMAWLRVQYLVATGSLFSVKSASPPDGNPL